MADAGVHVQVITKEGGNQYVAASTGFEDERWQHATLTTPKSRVGRRALPALHQVTRPAWTLITTLNGDIGGFVRKDGFVGYVSDAISASRQGVTSLRADRDARRPGRRKNDAPLHPAATSLCSGSEESSSADTAGRVPFGPTRTIMNPRRRRPISCRRGVCGRPNGTRQSHGTFSSMPGSASLSRAVPSAPTAVLPASRILWTLRSLRQSRLAA